MQKLSIADRGSFFTKIAQRGRCRPEGQFLRLLTLIRLGGGTGSHHWIYPSAISRWFEIMRSPLVTFDFKTLPKHRQTPFFNFLAQIWEMCIWRQVVSIDFDKKLEKFDFFQFFFKQILFLVWIWILCEKCFLLRYCMLKSLKNCKI